jgi:DNA-binding XRE family transcriptional regulator
LFFKTTNNPFTLVSFVESLKSMNDMDLQIKIGEKIRTIRLQKKMTQNDLAIACDFEKASMSRIESGRANPTVRTLNRISKALEIKIGDLFID